MIRMFATYHMSRNSSKPTSNETSAQHPLSLTCDEVDGGSNELSDTFEYIPDQRDDTGDEGVDDVEEGLDDSEDTLEDTL